jgi:hypothetical protein
LQIFKVLLKTIKGFFRESAIGYNSLFNFRLQLRGISYFCPYGITRRRF